MPNYIKRPEPGRFVRKQVVEKVVEVPKEQKSESLDINALANAVAQAINFKVSQPTTHVIHTDGSTLDTFDDSKTMDRLADQMLVQRGNGEANFDNLGNVKKTKKDQHDVDKTIGLLSNLND
jgi:hypothetical protein